MSAKDFYDNDLVKKRNSVHEVKIEPEPKKSGGSALEPANRTPAITGINPARMARYMEEVDGKVSDATEELERLKRRQDLLEKERHQLENLRSDQDKYEQGKREMLGSLEKYLVALGREELVLNQRIELVSETERRFKEMLAELRSLNEEEWPEDAEGLREQLTRALVVIEDMDKEYKKCVAKMSATSDDEPEEKKTRYGTVFDEFAEDPYEEKGFWYWVKVGFAVTLPLIITLLVLCGVIYMRGFGI